MNISGSVNLLDPGARCSLNASKNTSCSQYGPLPDPIGHPLRVAVTSAYAIVFLTSILGNGIGLRVVLRKSSVKTVSSLLIGNKAFADLLTTLLAMPWMVVYVHIQNVWFGATAGSITCKLIQFPFVVSLAASVFTILTISVGRFFAVFYPMRGEFLRNPKKITAVIWALAVVMMSPYLIPYQVVAGLDGRYYCIVDWGGHEKTRQVQQLYYLVLFIIMYAVPLTVTSITALSIGRRLWRRQMPGDALEVSREAARRSNRQVAKLLITIVAVFAICWSPAHTMHYFMYEPDWALIPMWVKLFSFWLCYASCAIDPFLYIIFNSAFRKEVERTLTTCDAFKSVSQKKASYDLTGKRTGVAHVLPRLFSYRNGSIQPNGAN